MESKKRQDAFEKMTPEQRKTAEIKIAERAKKKAAAQEAKARAEQAARQSVVPKKAALQEFSHYFRAVQLGKAEYYPAVITQLKKLFTVEDYGILRDQYIELIRTCFQFRTVKLTHPVKTEAAKFLINVMNETKTVELGLFLGLLTEGYISKTLASVLESQADLIKKEGYKNFIFQFAKEIYNRNGNLEVDGSITPFNASQKERIEKIYNLFM